MNNHQARVHSIEWLASGVLGFEFRPLHGEQWPAVVAGSHIDVHLPGGLVRSYSLVNAPGESHRYAIAVGLDKISRGGAAYMHERLRVGEVLSISEPRNSFPLVEEASRFVFIAGGIGITPLWSMVQRLSQLGAQWTLYYSARSIENAAFHGQISDLASQSGSQFHMTVDGGSKENGVNLRTIVDSLSQDAHVYCCGPTRMLEEFETVCLQRDPALVHREYFAAPQTIQPLRPESSEFVVKLTKSGRSLTVGANTTILETVLEAGIPVEYSCMSGICGACSTKVLHGIPDHRDFVLSESERASGNAMMICCSRAVSAELTLDL